MYKFERQARLLKIITIIRAHDCLTRRDIAGRCEVSIRTIARDLATLAYAGVPIFWDEDYGYQIMPGFFLPPTNLTLNEIDELMEAAEQAYGNLDAGRCRILQSAMSKILAGLPESIRGKLEQKGANNVHLRQT